MTAACCFEVFTIFPDVIDAFVRAGVLGKAIERGVVDVRATNIRDFANSKHNTVDDSPFGGGAGMVIKPGPVVDAMQSAVDARGPLHRVLLTPSAPRFDQRAAERLATLPRIALVCGRYEGIDERVREHFIDESFSIGDYVLGGGEVAALVLIEAVSRLVEGVLGNPSSAVSESYSLPDDGAILEYPQYTRPAEFRGLRVPDVLLGGDHGAIERWRQSAARRRTWALRPDLRPERVVPDDAPRWLAIDAKVAAEVDVDAWATVARAHEVAGVALLGGDSDLAIRFAAASGGKVAAAAVANLKALRKRLRRGAGLDPWIVRLIPPGTHSDELPHEARSPGELADVLQAEPTAAGRAIVLWAPDPGAERQFPANAVYAPAAAGVAGWLEQSGRGLAIPDAIDDAPRPRQQPAVLADVALATFPRSRADDRPGEDDPNERDPS